jgi:putative transposase
MIVRKPRKYVKWTPRLRKWVVRQCLAGITLVAEIAKNRKIPRRSIYMLLERFKKYGINGLDPKKRGRKKELINPNFEQFVLQKFLEFPLGTPKMYVELKRSGFGVSQRKLQEIYNKYKLKMNRRKRPSQIKFVKYEWPKPNALWHTDWSECPFTGKQLIAFIDDHSRFIVHAEYFSNATTENTILAFANAIDRYGIPENILTDNGVQFHIHGKFEEFCKLKNIKHILGRVHHPQTNGKIERWFGTYKTEFQPQRWTLNKYIYLYNNKRIHQGIGYQYPAQRYLKQNCANNSV